MICLFKNLNLLYNSRKYVYPSIKYIRLSTLKCIKCEYLFKENVINEFFCEKCSWPIDPNLVKNHNIYTLFKMEPIYNIDKQRLSQIHKQYQFVLHPDRHCDKSKREMEMITSNSSLVSTYYNILLDDKRRAKYLFDLKYGNEMFEEQINKTDEDQLEYIMEIHEKVDGISNDSERNEMKNEFSKKIEDAIHKIGESFQEDDPYSVIKNYRTLSFYKQIYEKLN